MTIAQRWWRAIRPHSLGTAIAPVLVGGGVALHDGTFRVWAFALAIVGVALLLVGVNLGNDYFDFRSGADPPIGLGARPLQLGLLRPRSFMVGSLVAFGVAGAIGLLLALASPPEVLLLGVGGALLGFFYTAPPLRLGYRGLGEVVVFLCLGPAATLGAYTVVADHLSTHPLVASIPIGLTVTALLHANNVRDLVEDARVGKRTLAVRLGESAALREYELLIIGSLVSAIILAVLFAPFVALTLLLVPLALPLARLSRSDPVDGRSLMSKTASFHLRLAVLVAIGYALSALV